MSCLRAFLDFCYIVRRSELGVTDLQDAENALMRFHLHREVFRAKVRPTGFSLPRQHALTHYVRMIQEFGAPNGLCSSITESRHITAVKRPWRRSNHFNALGQMLLTIQRLDKLAIARAFFVEQGMLPHDIEAPSSTPEAPTSQDIDHQEADDEAVDIAHIESHMHLPIRPREYFYCWFSV